MTGDYPLAIASGITPENIEKYLPYVDYFLVATGISKTFDEFDPEKRKLLAQKIHEFSN
jgi:predicted TIM-barrel enzyme